MASPVRDWHRLFGMTWFDFFSNEPVVVEMEKDLSLQQQFIDLVIVRKEPGVQLTVQLPDGFDDFGTHNLISYKSHHEPMDGEALNELVGHYVDYRKLVSETTKQQVPETEFRLYAVSARFPQGLNSQRPLTRLQEGVYEAQHFTGVIRVLVLGQLPEHPQNAMLHLFSAQRERIQFGGHVYRMTSPQASTLLMQLYDRYREEGMPMPFTPEEFEQQGAMRIAQNPELRRMVMKYVPVQDRLEGIPAEQRLAGLTEAELASLRQLLAETPPAGAGANGPTPAT